MELINVSPASAQAFATALLVKSGVSSENAMSMSEGLVLADLRGVDTHGINRIGGYIARITAGVVDPSPHLAFKSPAPVIAHLDAKNTFGFIAARMGIDKAIELASQYGVGVVAIKNSGHYGMAANYLLRAIDKGFAAMAFTNASQSMPPWGSRTPLLGTSPFAVGVPGGAKGNFVLDMSPSVVARGKIRKAARRGETIPEGWALDDKGADTTDPHAALKGVVLPIGGPKGSGLALMMDIFGGVLSGSAFGGEVNDQYKTLDKPQGVGHWFMVFRPEACLEGGVDELRSRMDTLLDRIRESEKAAGVERIYTSGEIEAELEKKRRAEGIPFTKDEVEALHSLAKEHGVSDRLVSV